MFKVLLIVYVIGGGKNITYTTGFEFQEFHSMTDCNTVAEQMVKIQEGQTYKDDSEIPGYFTTRCVQMSSTESVAPPPEPVAAEVIPSQVAPSKYRRHSRWDD